MIIELMNFIDEKLRMCIYFYVLWHGLKKYIVYLLQIYTSVFITI